MLSTIDLIRQILAAKSAADRGQSGSFTIAGEKTTFKNSAELDNEMKRIAPKILPIVTEIKDLILKSGLMHLVPEKLITMFHDTVMPAVNSILLKQDFSAADKKFEEFYAQMRKMAGLGAFE
ncbi:MAG: hypothetical protein ABSA81_02930 [Candidatus Bathyarchaeia archaeon]|jgi:hypothetical protein